MHHEPELDIHEYHREYKEILPGTFYDDSDSDGIQNGIENGIQEENQFYMMPMQMP